MCCFRRHGGQEKQQTQALNVLGVANSQAETRQFAIFKHFQTRQCLDGYRRDIFTMEGGC